MKYFTLEELCRSQKGEAAGIKNIPNEEQIENLNLLVDNVLDPLRKAWGKPIKVNSGYRNPQVNTLVGGSKTSDHMSGRAADITTGTICENRKLFKLIQNLGLPFDQLIDESNMTWIHISYRHGNNRQQIKKM